MPQLLTVTVPPPIVEEMLAEHIDTMLGKHATPEPELYEHVARAAEEAGYRTVVNSDGIDTVEQALDNGIRRRVIIELTRKQAQRLASVAHFYRTDGADFAYFGWPPANLRAAGTLLQGRITHALFEG
jgi:hypothetical protein